MTEVDVPEFERLADIGDQASKLESLAVEEGVKKVLKNIEVPPEDFDGVHCVDCGQEIVKARLDTGAFRDITCQEIFERNRKNHRSYYE